MKLLTKSIVAILTLFFVPETDSSQFRIYTRNAVFLNSDEWQNLSNLWMSSFYKAYKNLPLKYVDSDINGDTEEALNDWLRRRFDKYRILAKDGLYETSLIYKDSLLVGYTLQHKLPESPTICIDHFVVDPHFQGQGIGKALLAEVIENHPETKSIVLTTRILNTPARGFYKHLGFYEISGPIENVEFDPSNSVLLKKDINS